MTQRQVEDWRVRLLQLEHLASEVARLLRAACVDVLLLKGPVTNAWLYGSAESRVFRDVDVLVRPSQRSEADELLSGAGLVDLHARMLPVHRPTHERTWQRGGLLLDVHTRLAGVGAAQQEVAFDVLWAGRENFALQGRLVPVLGEPARVMHLALHAAQSRSDGRALRDLDRGLATLSPAVWERALDVAVQLGCTAAVAAGLRKTEAGSRLLDVLAPAARPTTEVLLRSGGASIEAQNMWEAITTRPASCALRALQALGRTPETASVPLRTRVSAAGRTGWALVEIASAAIAVRRR